ncbi:MAG: hypothetical protein Q9165_001036 [Trypethelium subeluteriae]
MVLTIVDSGGGGGGGGWASERTTRANHQHHHLNVTRQASRGGKSRQKHQSAAPHETYHHIVDGSYTSDQRGEPPSPSAGRATTRTGRLGRQGLGTREPRLKRSNGSAEPPFRSTPANHSASQPLQLCDFLIASKPYSRSTARGRKDRWVNLWVGKLHDRYMVAIPNCKVRDGNEGGETRFGVCAAEEEKAAAGRIRLLLPSARQECEARDDGPWLKDGMDGGLSN